CEQFVGNRVGHGGGAASHTELSEDVLDMVLGGVPADEQGFAYVEVGGAVGEQPQYLEFAGAEDRAGVSDLDVLALVPTAGLGAGLDRSYACRVKAVFAGEVGGTGHGSLGPGICGGEHPCADWYPLAADAQWVA